jgi:hypothetical protein
MKIARRALVSALMVLSLSGILLSQDAPVIRVINPNGGETLILGETTTIRWEASPPITPIRSTVTILLESDGRTVGTIAEGLRGDRTSYEWRIGEYRGGRAAPGASYKIRVLAGRLKNADDRSDSFFTIQHASSHVAPPSRSASHDFNIVNVRVNERGKLMAVIKDLAGDFSGNLTFSAEPPIAIYRVFVNLSRNIEREVEIGDIQAPIMVGGYVPHNEYTVRINSDSAVGETNWLNNVFRKRLPFYANYFWVFVTIQDTEIRAFVHGNSVFWQTSNLIRVRPHGSESMSLSIMNCGYNAFMGVAGTRQMGRWPRRSGDLASVYQDVRLDELSLSSNPGDARTHRLELATLSDSEVHICIAGAGTNADVTLMIRN